MFLYLPKIGFMEMPCFSIRWPCQEVVFSVVPSLMRVALASAIVRTSSLLVHGILSIRL